ncbi:mucin-4-like [Gambusia affinis]|uniref:mucin-4-like n=1 Tax=Gambusia affinis TaxID=33528 RepID=UPI001CDB9D0C|nr:mucin-4-like [Gambusia affinis]
MALSQIQCLDENNVNPRIHESKPEFFYCEEQRLALEALLRDGREAFAKYLESRGLRGFLSDLEQETLTAALEPFDPDADLFSGEREGEPEPLSLHYWPDVSDTSIPQMDLGWPDCESYRGVTRTTVYTQPPMEGQAHIKEVVRKMIAQAQKVIAVVMDVFTDVDIFRDLLDAGFKRKVSVYILLERTMLPHFLSMCRRANMHAGHLKHLRVRCTEGAEFYTRCCTRVKGQLGHRFMFIDGDKAVSGSYSFTWMSSRLDRNLITVTTGQAVNAFDQVFRYLYVTSSFVDLRQVTTDPEPEPDTRHQVLSVAPPSAAVARKLYNPKYALVALSSASPVNSSRNDTPKEPEVLEEPKNKKQKRTREDPPQDGPPIHPGLLGLEKACLLSYLPTWPEPDPPSDVIGFINIRDSKKPTQVHLQRSEMFEISQAIKFSSPFSKPQETLPEVAKPRNRSAQSESKTDGLLVDKAKPEKKSVGLVDNNNEEMAPEKNSPLHRQKVNLDESETQILQMQKKLCSDSDSGPVSLIPQALPQSSIKALKPNNEQPSHKAQITSTTSSLSESLKEFKREPEIATVSQTQSTFVDGTKTLKSNTAQKSQLHNQTQLNTEEHNIVSHQESNTNGVNTQPKISSEETCDLQNTDSPRYIATPSACPEQSESLLSKNNLVTITAVASTTATSSCNSTPSTNSLLIDPPSTSSFPKLPLLPSSASSFTSSVTPDSKPCSEQLLKQDNVNSNTETTPDIVVVVEKSKTSLGPQIITDVSALTGLVQTSPVKNLESGPELHRNSVSKTGHPNQTENTNVPEDTKRETQTSKNASNQESHAYAADTQLTISSEETCNLQNLGRPGHIATSSASPAQSENSLSKNVVTITAVASTSGTSSCNSAPSTSSLSTSPPSTSFPELPLLPSSASSFTSSVAPDSKPCSDQLFKQDRVKDNTETTPGISVDKRSKTNLGPQILTDASALTSLVQTSPVKNLDSGLDLQRNSVSKTGHTKQTENTNIPEDTKKETQTVTSQNASNQESHCNAADTQLKISSEKTCNPPNPGSPGYIATSSASPIQSESSLSKNNIVTITAVASTTGTSSCNSTPSTNSLLIDPPSTSSFPKLPLLPSSASSFTSSVAPDSKPCSDQLFKQDRVKDNTETTPGISVDKRSKTSLEPQILTDASALTSLVQTSQVKNLESGLDLRRNSVSKTGHSKQTENTNIPEDTKQETQTVTSQKRKGKETDRKHNDRSEVQSVTEAHLETTSDVSAKDSSSTAIVNINELIPKSVDSKTHRDCIATSTSSSTSDKTLTNLECTKATNTQTYLARCHEPQIISYSNFTLDDINKAQPLETSTGPTNRISDNIYILKENHDGSKNSAANAMSQPGKQAQVPSVESTIITLNSVKQHTHNTFLEQACITQGGAYTSRKTLNLPFSNGQAMDLSLQTNKQESQLPAADVQSSAPKVSPPNLPPTDSQTTSPDLQTPTTDISDDYLSSREDSTASEEYFECRESPSHEPVLDTSGCCSHGTGKNSSPTNSDCHFSRNVGTSSVDLDNISSASGLTSSSHSTSSSESSILSWTCREPPTSLFGTKGPNRETNITNRRNSKEGATIEVNSSNTEKKKERVHQSMEGTNSKELNQMPRSLKKESDLKEMALKLRKASGGQVEGATTDGESVQKETKRLSTGELKPERVLSEGKKSLSSKDKPTNQAALTPGNTVIRQRQSTRETTGQKPLNPSPKSQPRQQPGSRGSSPSRPLSSTRGSQTQAPRPSGIRDLSQTESRAPQSNVKEFVYKPPPRRSQSRSPSPMKAAPTGSAPGRKQVSQSQLLTRQPPAAQTRSKFDPPQIQAAKQQASTQHTLSSLQPQAHPLVSSQEVSEQTAHEPEEARVPFNLSLSRLYNFKGLRDKWTKLPTQSRRSSTGTHVKERKSTS